MVLACSLLADSAAASDIDLPSADSYQPIVFGAGQASRWTQGSYDVWLLKGNCYVKHGATYTQSDEAVLWVKHGSHFGQPRNLVIAYLEGNVRVENQSARGGYKLTDKTWFGEFFSTAPVEPQTPEPEAEPAIKPKAFHNGMARRDPYANHVIRRTQFVQFDQSAEPVAPLPGATRRLRAFPRSAVKVQAQWFPNPAGNEWVAVITSGVNLIIDGLDEMGSVDILTDRIVIWTVGDNEPDLTGQTLQGADTPLEIYMEGNVVFRQGDRVIYADSMYYDVDHELGTVLAAELLSPLPEYGGLVRLKADVIQQTGRDRFFAERAFVTSSRMARPGYRLQMSDVTFEDRLQPQFNPFTGQPQIDPATGEPLVYHDRLATSLNNTLFMGPVPVFYWPVMATNLRDPVFYIRRAQFKNDRIFGTQVYTDWDVYELLGIQNPPENTDWTMSLDYLSDRGPAGGTHFDYFGADLFNVPGMYSGFIDAWAIDDKGLDDLGSDRRSIPLDEDFRYRFLGRHRQQLPNNFQFSAELGVVSDRNFLEQYFETEWDNLKDQTTGIELKQMIDNMSWSVTTDVQVNDFLTQTEWLPRADHFWLGQPLFGDILTWYEHSQAAYAQFRPAPTPAVEPKLAPLPWELPSSGERLATRQEIDLPLEAGPVKIVPYALGELAHWGEDLTGDDTGRAYGQLGVRASIPFWAADPTIESNLFNVHGLAHKSVFTTDASYSDANVDLATLPLYDPLDDDSIEHFRRRFTFNTYGGVTPPTFDERFYALRSGLGSWVSSPSTEVADDMQAVRFGLSQRLQTKRGLSGQRRIIDWMVLDTQAVWFPDQDRDNFGENFGLLGYDYRWHVGDRLTLRSDGSFDFFTDGQQIFTFGAILRRPPRGSLYASYSSLEGPFSSQVISTSYAYRMSPKWVSTAALSYDFASEGTIGNAFSLTRVGESFLVSFAFNYDASKDNVGFSFMIIPRFLQGAARTALGGIDVPLAGLYGLE